MHALASDLKHKILLASVNKFVGSLNQRKKTKLASPMRKFVTFKLIQLLLSTYFSCIEEIRSLKSSQLLYVSIKQLHYSKAFYLYIKHC